MVPTATRPWGFTLREEVLYRILPYLLPDSVKHGVRVAAFSHDLYDRMGMSKTRRWCKIEPETLERSLWFVRVGRLLLLVKPGQ